jgi:hypothetical protein
VSKWVKKNITKLTKTGRNNCIEGTFYFTFESKKESHNQGCLLTLVGLLISHPRNLERGDVRPHLSNQLTKVGKGWVIGNLRDSP